jgi:succinyl-CoA synthetase alpha subunit
LLPIFALTINSDKSIFGLMFSSLNHFFQQRKSGGHVGAFMEGNLGAIESELACFREAGVPMVEIPTDVIRIAEKILKCRVFVLFLAENGITCS